MNCNLILHCGASAVPREALAEVVTPEATDTWRPIPHEDFVGRVERLLPYHNLKVVQQAHALTHDGGRYFGLMQVENGCSHPDYTWVLGLRNSHDKSLPAGLVAGSQVFVCDNLAFVGEVKVTRKHTSRIMSELPLLLNLALERLIGQFRAQDRRTQLYRESRLSDAKAHDLSIRALDNGVVCASRIPELLSEWREPRHGAFRPRTVWSWFNAATEVLKGRLDRLPARTQTLYRLCDEQTGYTATN